jgi:hypothetical protein
MAVCIAAGMNTEGTSMNRGKQVRLRELELSKAPLKFVRPALVRIIVPWKYLAISRRFLRFFGLFGPEWVRWWALRANKCRTPG